MLGTITDIISLITVAQLILFSLFLITTRERTVNKNILAGFLSANGIFIINFLLMHYAEKLPPFLINFLFIGWSFGFLFGPLLYLYTKSTTEKNFRLRKYDILHFIPFLITAGIILFRFQLQTYDRKFELMNTGIFNRTEMVILVITMNILTFAYLYKSFQILQNYEKNLKFFFSSVEKINFNWLKLVVTAFALMWFTDLVNWMLNISRLNTQSSHELLTFISLFINFVFANLIIFKSLQPLQAEDITKVTPAKVKYEGSALSDQEKGKILFSLEKLMATEKPYLEPSLNLGEVAQKLSVSSRYLSQVINELKKQNFYDFINSYRIEEVKKLLRDPGYESEKILGILYDCGFNSKSVFNTAFKKYTGVTPSEFRKKYRQIA